MSGKDKRTKLLSRFRELNASRGGMNSLTQSEMIEYHTVSNSLAEWGIYYPEKISTPKSREEHDRDRINELQLSIDEHIGAGVYYPNEWSIELLELLLVYPKEEMNI